METMRRYDDEKHMDVARKVFRRFFYGKENEREICFGRGIRRSKINRMTVNIPSYVVLGGIGWFYINSKSYKTLSDMPDTLFNVNAVSPFTSQAQDARLCDYIAKVSKYY